MSKITLSFLLTLIGTLPLTISPTAYAASDEDCSIWLCLPMAFPSGCGDAKKAFRNRIKKFKPPLPHFASCLAKDSPESNMTTKEGIAAKMPDGSYIDGKKCQRYYSGSGGGNGLVWRPYQCTGTWYFVETLDNGKSNGERYYYKR